MVTEEILNLDADRRTNRRVWWGVVGLLVVMLGAGAGFYLFYDIPDPDPASYAYEFKPVPRGENVLWVFERDTEAQRVAMQKDWQARQSENDKLSRFEPGCEETLRAHVEACRDLVERFQRLVREAERPLGYPGVSAELTLMTPMKGLSALQDGANAWRRWIELKALTGESVVASEQALELTEFAKELSECDSTLIHWLVMMTVQSMGLKSLEKGLKNGLLPQEVRRAYRQRLQAAELNHTDFARCVRMERFAQAKTWERLRARKGRVELDTLWQSLSGSSHWFEARTIKPNMTIVENGQLVSPIAQAMTESWAKGLEAAQEAKRLAVSMEDRGKWSNWLHPNFSGRSLGGMSFSAFDVIIQKSMQTVVLNRCLQGVLALRDYEVEVGQLPETLVELVPKYLPAVPEDPVTGDALKWNPRTERIYSVGEDGRDDGGDFEPDRNMKKQKDWGIVYPRPAITE
jgi:hypothetical protein